MHDVVDESGILQITTIDIHGFIELLHICGLLQLQGIQVGLGQVHNAAHQTTVLCD